MIPLFSGARLSNSDRALKFKKGLRRTKKRQENSSFNLKSASSSWSPITALSPKYQSIFSSQSPSRMLVLLNKKSVINTSSYSSNTMGVFKRYLSRKSPGKALLSSSDRKANENPLTSASSTSKDQRERENVAMEKSPDLQVKDISEEKTLCSEPSRILAPRKREPQRGKPFTVICKAYANSPVRHWTGRALSKLVCTDRYRQQLTHL